ncbi:MAG: 2-oxoacid:acceptor oxidoreductase family protein [Dehalococcoidia bacterium]|jgi:2-oxoglutarate ferredoxin oxidoreductase subunit gamma|nr:2-oxoacid:acceptor oxidoreductase family protein [Dehalococcoidia bacterium]
MSGNGKHEVIMAGIGGKGVLLAGQLLTYAAMEHYTSVTWSPTYYTLMRSGPSECTVVLSDHNIASPMVSRAGCVIIFEPSQLQDFLVRVMPGGILLCESAGLPPVGRTDIRIVKIPATEMAMGLGGPQAANFILLGAYVGLTDALPPELLEAQIDQRFPVGSRARELNRHAFQAGLEFGQKTPS